MARQRTFTADEESLVVRALIAIRPYVGGGELETITSIIRDGWAEVPGTGRRLTDPAGASVVCVHAVEAPPGGSQLPTTRRKRAMENLLGVGRAVAVDYGAEDERRGWVAGHAFVQELTTTRPMLVVKLAEGFWSDERNAYVDLLVCDAGNVRSLMPGEDVRDQRYTRLARQLRRQPVTAPSAEVAAMGRLRGEALEDEALLEVPGCSGWCAECVRDEVAG